jgi:hypothetical protein
MKIRNILKEDVFFSVGDKIYKYVEKSRKLGSFLCLRFTRDSSSPTHKQKKLATDDVAKQSRRVTGGQREGQSAAVRAAVDF